MVLAFYAGAQNAHVGLVLPNLVVERNHGRASTQQLIEMINNFAKKRGSIMHNIEYTSYFS